jgi:pimeloyl-ACP methyl ester carboxylesterase
MTLTADIARTTPGTAAGIDFLRRQGSSQGLPMVLLHGIGSNARSFEPLMAALPPSLTIIAWNAPGYGTSAPLATATPAPRDYAAALVRLLDAFDLERVILVGHSLGALFAASLAAHEPARVAGLALISPALGYRVAANAALPPNVQARIDELESLGPTAFAEKRAARLIHDAEHKPQVLAAVREAMAAVNKAGYAQAVRALGAGDLIADLARIPAPTLIAVGAEDVVTPPANAHRAFTALANPANYSEVAGAGHALPQENPAAVARLLSQLIESSHG